MFGLGVPVFSQLLWRAAIVCLGYRVGRGFAGGVD